MPAAKSSNYGASEYEKKSGQQRSVVIIKLTCHISITGLDFIDNTQVRLGLDFMRARLGSYILLFETFKN